MELYSICLVIGLASHPPGSSMWLPVSGFSFFLRPETTPLYIRTTCCLSHHLLMGSQWEGVGVQERFHSWLLWRMPLWTQMFKYLLVSLFSVPWGVDPDMELLDHLVFRSAIFFRNCHTVLLQLHHLACPTPVHPGSNFSTLISYFSSSLPFSF